MKTIIKRNLPLDSTYKIIDSFYSPLENGNCCDNCGKPITNIVKVLNEKDVNFYHVGLDCAETLSGISNDFAFNYQHKAAFEDAKQIRVKVLKLIKKAKQDNVVLKITATEFTNTNNYFKEVGSGIIRVESEPFSPHYSTWKQFRKELFNSHVLPIVKNLITE